MPNYAPELIASVGHQYLHTDKTIEQIARDHEVSSRDVNRMREREGWPARHDRIRRIPRATQLLQESTALQSAPLRAGPAAIERIERLLEEELAAVEAARVQRSASPHITADDERSADTLATLVEIFEVLQHLRGIPARKQKHQDLNDFDDMPADIDAFRENLARRIELLVARMPEESESRPSQPADDATLSQH